jgi:flagellar hook-associated protein 3 FlgL
VDIPASDVQSNIPETGKVTIYAGGVSLTMDMGVQVNAVDETIESSNDNGTWLYIRPTAVYQGDDNDTQVVIPYGSSTNTAADVSASGLFDKDVTVRIDADSGTEITYSYSLDSGNTWTQATAPSGPPTKLAVPGGFLDLDNTPAAGEQYVIHPHRAEITLDISSTSSITLNLIGKDVFGGLYTNPATGETEAVNNGGNIFEVVGKLIAACETNNQQGAQEALDELEDCMNVVLTKAAVVGGRENRLTMTESALIMRTYSEEELLSGIKDVDVIELSTRLAMQQTAYNSVLKSSSMIMQMSLVNFL